MLDRCTYLTEERQKLLTENKKLRQLAGDQNSKIDELENKNLSLQLSRSIVHEEGNTNALKSQLEEFIAEIDRHIALLMANKDQKA
ncbi:MAG: hypothetical protein M3Q97_00030 [Bacteroidota bacterium]|nr:hypothetical protein [Bacteroidota bacterium]